ncbi:ATG3 family protein [Megaselia abdita]
MQSVINTVKGTALNVAEYLTPVLKESKFKETGRLTPEEFIAAGEHLVHHCPTWQWASGDEAKCKPYLPKEKQFLITRNVPCYRRCKQMEYVGEEKIVEDDAGKGDGWVETHQYYNNEDNDDVNLIEDNLCEMTLDQPSPNNEAQESQDDDNNDDDEETVDMEEFEESGMLELVDPSTATISKSIEKNHSENVKDNNYGDDQVVHTRTYDLHITYDKYYQTPRLWVVGYDEVSYLRKQKKSHCYNLFSSELNIFCQKKYHSGLIIVT